MGFSFSVNHTLLSCTKKNKLRHFHASDHFDNTLNKSYKFGPIPRTELSLLIGLKLYFHYYSLCYTVAAGTERTGLSRTHFGVSVL